MSVIISWEQLLTPQLLPSGDLIRLTPGPVGQLDGSVVGFQLKTAPTVTWLKRIRLFDAQGQVAILQTEGNNHQTSIATFSVDAFNHGRLRVELVKAMAFNVATGVYELTGLGRWKSQLLFFEWLSD